MGVLFFVLQAERTRTRKRRPKQISRTSTPAPRTLTYSTLVNYEQAIAHTNMNDTKTPKKIIRKALVNDQHNRLPMKESPEELLEQNERTVSQVFLDEQRKELRRKNAEYSKRSYYRRKAANENLARIASSLRLENMELKRENNCLESKLGEALRRISVLEAEKAETQTYGNSQASNSAILVCSLPSSAWTMADNQAAVSQRPRLPNVGIPYLATVPNVTNLDLPVGNMDGSWWSLQGKNDCAVGPFLQGAFPGVYSPSYARDCNKK